jgi:AI-2 transport protein TqsA
LIIADVIAAAAAGRTGLRRPDVQQPGGQCAVHTRPEIALSLNLETAMSDGAHLAGSARAFYGLALAVLIGFIAYIGRGVIIPFIVGGFLSFFIFTLKETIKKGPLIGRYLPHWLCYVFAFAAIGLVFVLIANIVRENVSILIAKAPVFEERLRTLSSAGLEVLARFEMISPDFMSGIDELRSQALGVIRPLVSEIGAAMRSMTANVVTIALYTIFLLVERGRTFRKIGLLSEDAEERMAVFDTIRDIGTMVREFITLKTVVNLIVATLSFGAMRLIGVEFAGFWALLIFLLNYIPIVGAPSAIIAISLFTLVQPEHGGARSALLALGLLFAIEQTMGSFVEPRLMGRSLNLSPLVILLSLSIWGTLWGFAGALLAVPITVSIMIILTQFSSTRPIAILMSDSGAIAPMKRADQTG